MSDHRKRLRDAARAALEADVRIGALRHYRIWVRARKSEDLPAWSVRIPRDPSQLASQDGRDFDTQIEVIVARAGPDTTVEDDIDLDIEAIEAATLPALLSIADVITAEPLGVEFDFSGEGSATVIAARVQFRAFVKVDI